MKNGSRLVGEYRVTKLTRKAGFVRGYDDADVETWQVWCKSVGDGEERRATYDDMKSAGFRKEKKK
jgi:hypothetical protein